MTTTHTDSGDSERQRPTNPLALLISTIREIGGAPARNAQHKAAFKRLLSDPDYEEYRDAVIDEWVRIKYSTAFNAAQPPTTTQLKQRLDSTNAARDQAVNRIKAKIKGRLLQLIMPNGKCLADCTGTECSEFGGWYTTIGEHVGPMNLVGNVLTESELMRLLARSG